MAGCNADVMSRRQVLGATLPPRRRRGRRDEPVSMFEDHFPDANERAGAPIVATWRDLDAPEGRVLMPAFEDAAARLQPTPRSRLR